MNNQYEVIIVIPVYNEGPEVIKVISDWKEEISKHVNHFYFVILNDGSNDETAKHLEQLNELNQIEVIHKKNEGHGPTIYKGYKKALELNTQYILQIDSDNQVLPKDFKKIWKRRSRDSVVLGNRNHRHDPVIRLKISSVMKSILYILFGENIIDPNIPFRIIGRDFLKKYISQVNENSFAPNIFFSLLAAQNNKLIDGIEVTHQERMSGQQSLFTFSLFKACITTFYQIFLFWVK